MNAAETKQKLNWLQCVRAMAAILVAGYHAAGRAYGSEPYDAVVYAFFKFGSSGVDLFFVISGFIIAFVHGKDVGRPDRLPAYAYRRLTRIYPPYWILFALVMPLYFLVPSAGEDFQRHWANLLRSFFLLPSPPKQVIGVAWTLVYEMIFYAVFAVAIWHRKLGQVLIAAWLICILWNALVPLDVGFYGSALLSVRFFGFFFGAAVAIFVQRLNVTRSAGWLMPAAALAFIAVPHLVRSGEEAADLVPLDGRLALYAVAAILVASSLMMERSGYRAPRILVRLGDATYSIYLFHWLVGWIYAKMLDRSGISLTPSVEFLSMLVLMIAGGYCAYLLVEKRLLNLSQAAWRSLSPGRPVPNA